MAFLQSLMFLVNGRLSAAAEEICGTVGRILREYEVEALYLKQEIDHKSRLLDMALKERINLQRADILQQCERNYILVQGEPEPPHIKEEQDEQLVAQEEGLIIVEVKIEDDVEVPVASTSTGHLTAQGDSEECEQTQPTSDNQNISSHGSESDTEDSDEWELSRDDQSALNKLASPKTQNVEGQMVSHTLTHTAEESISCSLCGKGFASTRNLKNHMRIHIGEKTFVCTVCGKGCIKKAHLMSHMRTHTTEKPFPCSLCGKGFARTNNLKNHMRSHKVKEPFVCTVCGKCCSKKAYLESHMRTHTGERQFMCTVCGKGCSRMEGLKMHVRTHTGEKPFTCTVCSKGFAKMDYLKAHMKTHTGEKPFVCTVCGKGCSQRVHLMSHMRTHTGGQNI